MITGPIIAEIAALVGDPARATMVAALLDGRALTASELAFAARITPQTASAHLAKLTEAGLVSVVRSGRHRYFRLVSPAVVDMIDGIVAVALEKRPLYHRYPGKHGPSGPPGFASTNLRAAFALISPNSSSAGKSSCSAPEPTKA